MKKPNCKVEGCEEPSHARGYCRKHYARMWRAKENAEAPQEPSRPKKAQKAATERTRALQYELSNAMNMYESVIGVASRIKWKKRIRWLENELRSLESGLEDLF